MSKTHHFAVKVVWTGNQGTGTSAYTAYARNHTLSADGKAPLACSSAPAFRGDGTLYNPEDMLLYSVSSCHMLWFLHCCADAGVVAMEYHDSPEGTLTMDADGIGKFTSIVLNPAVVFLDPMDESLLKSLHEKAHQHCFIANTLNCPVEVKIPNH
jgi:organic hydroperoxide reductase OsmC/OhrA